MFVAPSSGLEIVDAQGRVRASITIEPPVVVDSKAYPESVLLRLSDPNGPLTGSLIKVTSSDGREQFVKP